MPNVLFATNRQPLPDAPAGTMEFGDTALPQAPDALLCGTAVVTDIDISQPDAGTIERLSGPTRGGFTEADLAPVLASQNDILVFVHGAENSFTDAIGRAAYNKEWLGQGNVPGVSGEFDVIAFTWPGRSYVVANIVGDYIDYRHDQTQAAASAFHFGLFIAQMQALRARIGKRRMHLLCHSMGNYMLGGAVEMLFRGGAAPATPLFDEVVLAAADEVSTTFTAPNGGRLANLWRLGREITVYYNNDDIMMALSHLANQDYRLGYDGPPNAADTGFFSTNVYEFVNCTGVNDYISGEVDRSHQYYRQSPTVRKDILATLGGVTPVRRSYDAAANVYALFPPVVVAAANGAGDVAGKDG